VGISLVHCLQRAEPIDDYDKVLLSLCGSKLLLATPGSEKNSPPECPRNWRCRVLTVSSETDIADFNLSRTGTKLAILFKDHSNGYRSTIFDLSTSETPTPEPAVTHHVPGQKYRLSVISATEAADFTFNDYHKPIGRGEEAALTEQLPVPPEWNASFQQACNRYSSSLPQAAESDELTKLYRLQPDPKLYAPIIEFAQGENVFPTRTDIWSSLAAASDAPLSWETSSKALAQRSQRAVLSRKIFEDERQGEAGPWGRVCIHA
jgi:hypothetical protein